MRQSGAKLQVFPFPSFSYLDTYGQAFLGELHVERAVSPNCITTYELCLSSMFGTLGSITDSGL